MTMQFAEVVLERWNFFHSLVPRLFGYVFRGQSDSKWQLATSLQRSLSIYQPIVPMPENKEHWTLHEFRSKSHLYVSHKPEEDDNIEWLALMQHHGCPTRLLDFTESPYIAAYFAIVESTSDAAIWALNRIQLRDRVHGEFKFPYSIHDRLKDETNIEHLKLANTFIGKDAWKIKKSFLIPLIPKKLSDRISRQQGLFIFPTNASESFMRNLAVAYSVESENDFLKLSYKDVSEMEFKETKPQVIKLVLPKNVHRDALKDLMQMNITAETLFGGLDGLAKSLLQKVIRD